MSDKPIKVSILCNTYNHEKTIKSTLDGFLSQKVNFDYEICIHDDASSDKTVQILKDYKTKYPDLFKLILEKENQFTQAKIIMELNTSQANGEYLAVCDGDDVWTDPYKLQKQADILDQDPEVSLVISAYTQVSLSSFFKPRLIQFYPTDTLLTLEDILSIPHRSYGYHTYMFRGKDKLMPDSFRTLRFTDLPRLLYSAFIGKIYYMKDPTALYRRGLSHSWSMNQIKNRETVIDNQVRLQAFYTDLDKTTQRKYHEFIQRRIALSELNISLKQRDKRKFFLLLKEPQLDYLSSDLKRRMINEIHHPFLYPLYRSLRMKYWK